jgi:AcrR family transcriptional regulator
MSNPGRPGPARSPARTQASRSQATVGALLAAARDLFAQDGYPATSLDDVVAKAGLTKGALYHHFDGKRELFRAVYEQEQERLLQTLSRAAHKRRGAWNMLRAACEAFLDSSLDPAVQRITLLDAPTALGWETMREIENEGSLKVLKDGLEHAMDEGSIRRRPVDPLAHLLFGALCEAAMTIARAPDQQATARRTRTELRRLLDAFTAR